MNNIYRTIIFVALAGLSLAFPLAIGTSLRLATQVDWETFTPSYADRPHVRLRYAGALMPRSNPVMRLGENYSQKVKQAINN